jgi:curved DNA-binding protein CbpA
MLLLGKLEQAVKFCQLRVDYMNLEEFNNPANGWCAFLETANRVSHHCDVIGQVDAILGNSRNPDCLADAEKCAGSVFKMLELLGGHERRSAWGKRLGLTKVKALMYPLAGKSGQRCEDRLSWCQQGLDEVERLVLEDSADPMLHHWKGRCLLRMSLRSQACESFEQAVRLAGGKHQATQELLESMTISENAREQGKQAFLLGEYKAAQEHYDMAVRADRQRLDPEFSATLFCSRSTCCHKRGGNISLCSALEDINRALFLRPSYTKAFIRKGLVCMDQERYESARASFNDAAKIEPQFPGLVDLQARARRWAVKPPSRNYYAVLRVGFDATEASIKKSYKAAALKWHPDKNPADFSEASRVFKDIQEAFNVLSDVKMRRAYDKPDDRDRNYDKSSGGESASDTPDSCRVTAYKPFFGASFGTSPDFGYKGQDGPVAAAKQGVDGEPNGQDVSVVAGEAGKVGHVKKLKSPYNSGGSRFAGWKYEKADGNGSSKSSLGEASKPVEGVPSCT